MDEDEYGAVYIVHVNLVHTSQRTVVCFHYKYMCGQNTECLVLNPVVHILTTVLYNSDDQPSICGPH